MMFMKDSLKLARKFDKQADLYRKQRENKKFAKYRKKIVPNATGKVLELAVGAGANFFFYSADVFVTAVDISPKMVEYAKEAARIEKIQAEFMLANIEALHFPKHSFDTIVSTLSFCGYTNPIELFNKLSYWCKPGGKILLMEHGISTNPLLAGTLKLLNPIQYKFVGCHLKRDMLELIHASDLQVQHVERYWKGMLYLIWASPNPK